MANHTAPSAAIFGSGLRLGQLYLRMWEEAESVFPAGLCGNVGTAGHLLGALLLLKADFLAQCTW